jgi:hypothetical protein
VADVPQKGIVLLLPPVFVAEPVGDQMYLGAWAPRAAVRIPAVRATVRETRWFMETSSLRLAASW